MYDWWSYELVNEMNSIPLNMTVNDEMYIFYDYNLTYNSSAAEF
jgi:hypothetical protein